MSLVIPSPNVPIGCLLLKQSPNLASVSGRILLPEVSSEAHGILDGLIWTWNDVRPKNLINGTHRIAELIEQGVLNGDSIGQGGMKALLIKFAETLPCFSRNCPLYKEGVCEPFPHPYPEVIRSETRARLPIEKILQYAVFPIASDQIPRISITRDTLPIDMKPIMLNYRNKPLAG